MHQHLALPPQCIPRKSISQPSYTEPTRHIQKPIPIHIPHIYPLRTIPENRPVIPKIGRIPTLHLRKPSPHSKGIFSGHSRGNLWQHLLNTYPPNAQLPTLSPTFKKSSSAGSLPSPSMHPPPAPSVRSQASPHLPSAEPHISPAPFHPAIHFPRKTQALPHSDKPSHHGHVSPATPKSPALAHYLPSSLFSSGSPPSNTSPHPNNPPTSSAKKSPARNLHKFSSLGSSLKSRCAPGNPF